MDAASQLLAENHTAGILSGLSVTNGFDAYLRRTRLYANTATAFTNLYGYDTASRLTGVTNGAFSAGYTYLANSPLLNQVTFKQSGTTRMTDLDDIGNRTIAKAGGDAAGGNLRSAGYTNNVANQLTSRGVPGAVDVVGIATAGAAVTVNGSGADYRRGKAMGSHLKS